jgi:hypothetical protein
MKIGGVDYSMTSPAITIYDTESKEFHFHFYNGNKKLFSRGNFHGTLHIPHKTQEQRFDDIGEWALSIVRDCSYVFLEGYAFGAKGQVFHIGENTGILKNKLWKNSIPFDTIGPTELKKWAAGKGSAKKEHMETAFVIDTGIQVREEIGQSEAHENPSSDIIDSYFLCKMGLQRLGIEV